jgi:hypothetical protein
MRARNNFPQSKHQTHSPGDLVHYVISFLETITLHFFTIFSNFLDDHTSYKGKFIHKARDAITNSKTFNQYLAIVKSNRLKTESMRVASRQTDNGPKTNGKQMIEWATENQIVHETRAPHTPSQLGKVEVIAGNSSMFAQSMQITANTPVNLQGAMLFTMVSMVPILSIVFSHTTLLLIRNYMANQLLFKSAIPLDVHYYLCKRQNPGWKVVFPEYLLVWEIGKARKHFFCINHLIRSQWLQSILRSH